MKLLQSAAIVSAMVLAFCMGVFAFHVWQTGVRPASRAMKRQSLHGPACAIPPIWDRTQVSAADTVASTGAAGAVGAANIPKLTASFSTPESPHEHPGPVH
jgi:hypothetical protein